jgi:hypothetical protein
MKGWLGLLCLLLVVALGSAGAVTSEPTSDGTIYVWQMEHPDVGWQIIINQYPDDHFHPPLITSRLDTAVKLRPYVLALSRHERLPIRLVKMEMVEVVEYRNAAE